MPDLPPTPTPASRTAYLCSLIIVLVALAAMWPARRGEFLNGDDRMLIVEHALVNHPSVENAGRLLTMVHDDLYQPLPMVSFLANYALAAPDARFVVSPGGFHWTNIALHLLNSVLVFWLARTIARCSRVGLITGLLFACHPFAVEATAWINGRMILMATAFSLVTILFCVRPRISAASLLGSCLAWFLALACKVLPTVPVTAAVLDVGRSECGIATGIVGTRLRRWQYGILILTSLAATVLVYRTTQRTGAIDAMAAEPTGSLPIRIAAAMHYYLTNYFWPHQLSNWSSETRGATFTSPMILAGIAETLALLFVAAGTWRRNRTIALGLVVFLILLAPFLAVTAARRLITADRYMYFPIMGLHLACAAIFVSTIDWFGRMASRTLITSSSGGLLIAVLAACIWTSRDQCETYHDTVSRALRSVTAYPDDVRARAELARAYNFENRAALAIATVDEARRRWPHDAALAAQAGEARFAMEQYAKAFAELSDAVAGRSGARPRFYRALTLEKLHRTEDSRADFERLVADEPTFLPGWTALGRIWRQAGDLNKAAAMYRVALTLDQWHTPSMAALAEILTEQGRPHEALRLLRDAWKLNPSDPRPLSNLAARMAQSGDPATALTIEDELLRAAPNDHVVRLNRAGILAALNRTSDAEREFRVVLTDESTAARAMIGLHELLLKQGRFADLADEWKKYLANHQQSELDTSWMLWAYLPMGRTGEAQIVRESFPQGSESRAFADWAFAVDTLRRKQFEKIPDTLPIPAMTSTLAERRQDEARTLRIALAALPADIRETPAAYFLLTGALLYDGHRAMAEATLQKLTTLPAAERYRDAAQRLLRESTAATQPALSPSR